MGRETAASLTKNRSSINILLRRQAIPSAEQIRMRFSVQTGNQIINDLADKGILIRSPSVRGVAEEAPGAYKDVGAVVMAAEEAGLARRVGRLRPLVCVKG